MDNIDLMNYWLKSSDKDYETMIIMYESKRNTWALFIGHLVIEKLLKGLFAKNNADSPYEIQIRNIEEVRKWLKEILMNQ